jgi:hypothetical protein
MRRKLRLVGSDPADIFDNLEVLRQEQARPTTGRRTRLQETFARIPHDKAVSLYRHLGGAAWLLLVEIDRLILEGRGRNPVKLTGRALSRSGMTRYSKRRALRQLEAAGVITVTRRGCGRAPLVTLLWLPVRG